MNENFEKSSKNTWDWKKREFTTFWRLTDCIGKQFLSKTTKNSDSTGKINFSESEFQGLIAKAENDRSAVFLVFDLDKYFMDILVDEKVYETISIESGIGSTIIKEKWREGGLLANVYYPITGGPNKERFRSDN